MGLMGGERTRVYGGMSVGGGGGLGWGEGEGEEDGEMLGISGGIRPVVAGGG